MDPVASRARGGSQLSQPANVAYRQTWQARGTAWDDDESASNPGDEKRAPRAPNTLADHIDRSLAKGSAPIPVRVEGPPRGIRSLPPRATRKCAERHKERNTLTKFGTHIASFLVFGLAPPELVARVLFIVDRAFMKWDHPAVTGVCMSVQDAVRLLPRGIPKTITSLRDSDTYLTAIAKAVEMYQYQRFLHWSYMNHRLADVDDRYDYDGSDSTSKMDIWRGALLGHIVDPLYDHVINTPVVDTVFVKTAVRRFLYPRIAFDEKTLTLSVWKQYARQFPAKHGPSPPFETKTSFSDAKVAFEYMATHVAQFFSDYDEGTLPVVLGEGTFTSNHELRSVWDTYWECPIEVGDDVDWYWSMCECDPGMSSVRDLLESTLTEIDASLGGSPETTVRQEKILQDAHKKVQESCSDIWDSDDDDDPWEPRRRRTPRPTLRFIPNRPAPPSD